LKLIVLDGATLNPGDNPWTPLEAHGDLVVYERTVPEEVVARAFDADLLVINKVKLPEPVLAQLPCLKFIAVTATGFDCVDVAAARRQGVPVANVPVYGTDSVAQYVFALLLERCHQVTRHTDAVKDGAWVRRKDFSFWLSPLVELQGKTMGIIGFGRIGRRCGELAHAFGMKVLANSRKQDRPPDYQPFAWATRDEIAAESDVISLHCPLTPETRGMVDSAFLARARQNLILINTARGGLVVEQELAEALNTGSIAAAALDVVSSEPITADNPLLHARNCTITPHMAWATLEARKRLMAATAGNIAAFLAGKPEHVVN